MYHFRSAVAVFSFLKFSTGKMRRISFLVSPENLAKCERMLPRWAPLQSTINSLCLPLRRRIFALSVSLNKFQVLSVMRVVDAKIAVNRITAHQFAVHLAPLRSSLCFLCREIVFEKGLRSLHSLGDFINRILVNWLTSNNILNNYWLPRPYSL